MSRYHPGEIIRRRHQWGVIISDELPPLIDWWDQGHWYTRRWYDSEMVVINHDSVGVPDAVLARATAMLLAHS
jgi:hypothetical protein